MHSDFGLMHHFVACTYEQNVWCLHVQFFSYIIFENWQGDIEISVLNKK